MTLPTDTLPLELQALVVDTVSLRELQSLVENVTSRDDASRLRDFHQSRAEAHDRLNDADATWLDPAVLVTALLDIGCLEKCTLTRTPEVRRLLHISQTIDTRARYVSKGAYTRLAPRAKRLRFWVTNGMDMHLEPRSEWWI